MEMRAVRVARVTHLTDEGVGTDGVADRHGDRTRHEMSVLGGVVVDAVTIHIMLDIHEAAPSRISIGVRIRTVTVLDIRHDTRSGGVDVVAFVAVEVISTVARGQRIIIDFILRGRTTHTVVPGTAIDLDAVVVDRQNEGTIGQSLGGGQEEAQDHEKQNEQRLAHWSFLLTLNCQRTILL